MGRWAQRSRSGGGAAQQISIVSVVGHAEFDITLRFSTAVTVVGLGASDFFADPPGVTQDSLTQIDSRTIKVNYTSPVDEAATVTFTAAVPGFKSPQVVNL